MRSGIHTEKTRGDWESATYLVTFSGDWLERFQSAAASLGTAGSNYLRELVLADVCRRSGVDEPPIGPRRGRGSVYLRGNVWWMKYYVGGVAVRASTGCRVRKAAEHVLDTTLELQRASTILRKEPRERISA